MKKNNDFKRDIHVQAIITSLAAATFDSQEWENPQFYLSDLERIINFWQVLIDKYGEYPVQEISFNEIKYLLSNYDGNETSKEFDDDLINRTMKFLKLQIEDNERFEGWIRNALKSTHAMKDANIEQPMDIQDLSKKMNKIKENLL